MGSEAAEAAEIDLCMLSPKHFGYLFDIKVLTQCFRVKLSDISSINTVDRFNHVE